MFRKRRTKIKVEPLKTPEVKDEPRASDSGLFSKSGHGECPNMNVNQTVNVTVNEDQESDIASCFKACFGCIGKAGKAAV